MLKIENYDQLLNNRDMLEGNLNRMAVTDNFDELDAMYGWSLK